MPAITKAQVRRRLVGMIPYIENGPLGEEGYDDAYQEAIDAAHDHFERELQMRIDPTVILALPTSTQVMGDDYDRVEAPFSYVTGSIDRTTLPKWRTKSRPIISVQSVRLQFGETYPVLEIPEGWLRVNHRMGIIDVIPIGVAAIAGTMGAWYAPLIDRAWPWKIIPQFVAVDYTAGFTDPDTHPELAEMRVQLARYAAICLIRDNRRLVPTNVSLDGFSQNFEAPERVIEQETVSVEKFMASWTSQNRPPRMLVI